MYMIQFKCMLVEHVYLCDLITHLVILFTTPKRGRIFSAAWSKRGNAYLSNCCKVGCRIKVHRYIKCIQSNERIRFRGVKLSGLDLSKLDLTKIDFSYACLRNVCFSNCDLHGAKLNYVDAKGANFSNASLESSEFVGANLRIFVGANLGSAKKNCSFWGASLVATELHDIDLRNASLEGACLVSTQLLDVDLANANLEGASRERADLKNMKTTTYTKFKDANLQETYVENEFSTFGGCKAWSCYSFR